MRAVILSGDPFTNTRCVAIAKRYQAALQHYPHISYFHFDLNSLAAGLGSATSLQTLDDDALEACQHLLEAELLIIICPIVHQSFPGLFKHVFDLLDPTALRNKTALLCTTGATLYSAVPDRQLRPLLDHLGIYVLPIDSYIPYTEIDAAPLPDCFALHNSQHLQRIYFSVNQAVSLVSAKSSAVA